MQSITSCHQSWRTLKPAVVTRVRERQVKEFRLKVRLTADENMYDGGNALWHETCKPG